MLRNLVSSLIKHERIETTLPKAKEMRRLADKMITLAKQGDLAARRRAAAFVYGEETVRKLFDVLGPRYQERQGGYTRVMRSRYREGDNALMAWVEYVDREGEIRPARPPKGIADALTDATPDGVVTRTGQKE